MSCYLKNIKKKKKKDIRLDMINSPARIIPAPWKLRQEDCVFKIIGYKISPSQKNKTS